MIKFTVPLAPVPYTRMTQRGKFVKKQAQRYIISQTQLAWHLKLQWNNKPPITRDLCVIFQVWFSDKRKRDGDNVAKAICDALQKADVIKDDKQVKEMHWRMYLNSKRGELTLIWLKNLSKNFEEVLK